jgi:RNase P subunit RPR2
MKLMCKNCGDLFTLPKKVLKAWDDGEIDMPTLCPDCEDDFRFMGCNDFEYERYSDADPGL